MRKNVRDDRARLEDLTPPLVGERCRLRPYVAGDVAALVAIANDERVSRWLATHFPFPYDLSDAKVWVANAARERPTNNFAIEVDGALAGGVGLGPMHGEKRGVAEFGYWLGIAWWGRGVATEAARLLADHALKARGFGGSKRSCSRRTRRRRAFWRSAHSGSKGARAKAWSNATAPSSTACSTHASRAIRRSSPKRAILRPARSRNVRIR